VLCRSVGQWCALSGRSSADGPKCLCLAPFSPLLCSALSLSFDKQTRRFRSQTVSLSCLLCLHNITKPLRPLFPRWRRFYFTHTHLAHSCMASMHKMKYFRPPLRPPVQLMEKPSVKNFKLMPVWRLVRVSVCRALVSRSCESFSFRLLGGSAKLSYALALTRSLTLAANGL